MWSLAGVVLALVLAWLPDAAQAHTALDADGAPQLAADLQDIGQSADAQGQCDAGLHCKPAATFFLLPDAAGDFAELECRFDLTRSLLQSRALALDLPPPRTVS